MALINGTAYSWSSIKVLINGVPINGVTGISYNQNREIVDNYGIGSIPVSRGYGNITTEASITIMKEELQALQLAAPGGKLYNIPEFSIIVSYIGDAGSLVVPVVHVLKQCRFKNNGRQVAQGDTMIEQEIELAIGDISWGV